ncbi:MAG: hypothetical protein RI897_4440 [Verrucomicrobiota bacterium]
MCSGVGCALVDPGDEVIDGGFGEFAAVAGGGHLEVGIGIGDGFNEPAIVGVTWDDGGAAVTALEECGGGIDEEAGFGFAAFGAMAGIAGFDEDGADVGFEEVEGLGFLGERGAGEEEEEGEVAHGCWG